MNDLHLALTSWTNEMNEGNQIWFSGNKKHSLRHRMKG